MIDEVEVVFLWGYDGVCMVFLIYMMIGVCVNEVELWLFGDIELMFIEVVFDDGWDYDEFDGNVDLYFCVFFVGNGVLIFVVDGVFDFGWW